jgi:hypothetical protein
MSKKVSKQQLKIIDAMHAGAWIWTVGEGKDESAYLAEPLADGQAASRAIHKRTFEALKTAETIKPTDNNRRWVLSAEL